MHKYEPIHNSQPLNTISAVKKAGPTLRAGSQMGEILPTRGHPVVSAEMLGSPIWRGQNWNLEMQVSTAAKYPALHRTTSLPNKGLSCSSINSSRNEKPSPRV